MPHSVTWRIVAANCELSGVREALTLFVHHEAQNGACSQLGPLAATVKEQHSDRELRAELSSLVGKKHLKTLQELRTWVWLLAGVST